MCFVYNLFTLLGLNFVLRTVVLHDVLSFENFTVLHKIPLRNFIKIALEFLEINTVVTEGYTEEHDLPCVVYFLHSS
jgi:hypothetical protein